MFVSPHYNMGRGTNFVQNKHFPISGVERASGGFVGVRGGRGRLPNFPYQPFSASQGRALSVSSRDANEFVP